MTLVFRVLPPVAVMAMNSTSSLVAVSPGDVLTFRVTPYEMAHVRPIARFLLLLTFVSPVSILDAASPVTPDAATIEVNKRFEVVIKDLQYQ